MRTQLPLTLLAAAFVCSLFTAPAYAQRARVFVASYGNDSNPCTFLSPCKTFQQAVNVVAFGGEVTAIDSAGFGPINITKAVTITSPNGVEAGIVPVMGGNSITINAGLTDAVNLQGLTLDGAGIGQNGIAFNTGGTLTIENCVIRNAVGAGIYYVPTTTGTGQLVVSHTLVTNNDDRGIHLLTQTSTEINAAFNHVEVTSNGSDGLFVEQGVGGTSIVATVSESVAALNKKVGFNSSGGVTLHLFHSVATGNATGLEVAASSISIAETEVTDNVAGWVINGGGTIDTFIDNHIIGNGANTGSLSSVPNQ